MSSYRDLNVKPRYILSNEVPFPRLENTSLKETND